MRRAQRAREAVELRASRPNLRIGTGRPYTMSVLRYFHVRTEKKKCLEKVVCAAVLFA